MAVKISSIVLNAGRDDDRISGFKRNSDLTVLWGGMAITQDPTEGTAGEGKTIKVFDGTAAVSASNPKPLGLVIENTHGFTGGFISGETQQGSGYNTLNNAWGDIYSAFHRPGNILDVFDDFADRTVVTVNAGSQGASCPFWLNDTWGVGKPVFADANGLLCTSQAAPSGGARLGWVRAMFGSGPSLRLAIELDIAIVA